jgi:hypothetical protein
LSEAHQLWVDRRAAGQSENAAWDSVVAAFPDIPPEQLSRLKSAVRIGGSAEKSMTLGQALKDAEDALPPLSNTARIIVESDPVAAQARRAQVFDTAIEQAVMSRNPELVDALHRARGKEIQGPEAAAGGENRVRYKLDPKTKKLVPVGGTTAGAAPVVAPPEEPPPLIPEKKTYAQSYREEAEAQKQIRRAVELIRSGNSPSAYAELLRKFGQEKAVELFDQAKKKSASK